MARTDVIVLGAGIVGTSIALHLAKRGLGVALVDRRAPGEETSYGNAGVIEGNTLFPHPFPAGFAALLRVALKRATEANYHLSFLPQVAPWLLAYRANSTTERRTAFAHVMRPLFARALAEHEALMAEAGATGYLRKDGWLKLYRSEAAFAPARASASWRPSSAFRTSSSIGAGRWRSSRRWRPVFRGAVHWPRRASVTNPLAVTKAYAARFAALGGVLLTGDARSLQRSGADWRVDTDAGPLDAPQVVLALGPWTPDVLGPLGLKLPLARQARLSPAFPATRQCRPDAPGGRCRARLLRRADGAGDPAHHRRRIRRARCAADAGSSSIGCCRRRARCFRSASRSKPRRGWGAGPALPIHGR